MENLPRVAQAVRERRYTYLKNNEDTIPLGRPEWPDLKSPVRFDEALLQKASRDGTLLKVLWSLHKPISLKNVFQRNKPLIPEGFVGDVVSFVSLGFLNKLRKNSKLSPIGECSEGHRFDEKMARWNEDIKETLNK